MSKKGWIGVDLDGTLAHYDGWVDELHIGEPISLMAERVKQWLADDIEVRIFTARVHPGGRSGLNVADVTVLIQNWTMKHFGQHLQVTNLKDFGMYELWDDRAVQVIKNTGERADGKQHTSC